MPDFDTGVPHVARGSGSSWTSELLISAGYACGHPHGAVWLRSSRRLRAHSSASVSRLR